MSDNLLIMFVKYPEPGQVKSRLAATLGDQEAARVYKAITEGLLSAVDPSSKGAGYDMAVAYSPADAAKDMQSMAGQRHTAYASVRRKPWRAHAQSL